MKRVVLAVLLLSALSGCVGSDSDSAAEDAAVSQEVMIDEERPEESFGEIDAGPAVGPDLNATTAAPPELIPGEWWRVQFDAYLGEELVEVIRVVAEVHDEGYVVGMPHSGWLKEAIAFHSPAFGDVNLDLSYNTHNTLFQPVKFPLVEGDSWETHFAAVPYVATVESADEYTATIRFTQPQTDDPTTPLMEALGLAGGGDMLLTYDARQHEIVRMESAIGVWEVVEHGYDFEGWVTIPRGQDTAIDYGVVGPASDQHTPAEKTTTVDGGFNRLTLMHFVGTVNENTPGQFQARDVDPHGNEFVTELQGAGIMLRFYESRDPDGEWVNQDIVAGAGFNYHMGIAYHQYDIKLPDGLKRSDHSHPVVR